MESNQVKAGYELSKIAGGGIRRGHEGAVWYEEVYRPPTWDRSVSLVVCFADRRHNCSDKVKHQLCR